jgi:hypothetical protein
MLPSERVQVTENNRAWIFQRRIHKQASVNCRIGRVFSRAQDV